MKAFLLVGLLMTIISFAEAGSPAFSSSLSHYKVGNFKWGPPQKIRLGADSNACGILAPITHKKLPIYIWLHGGMRSAKMEKGWDAYQALIPIVPEGSALLASPSAYAECDWLTPLSITHIEKLLENLAKQKNGDLKRFVLVGVSDGTLGALRYTRDGKYKPIKTILISSMPQLAVSPFELSSEPAFKKTNWEIFQGGKDRLFPREITFPVLINWAKNNSRLKLHLEQDGEHDLTWWMEHQLVEIKSAILI